MYSHHYSSPLPRPRPRGGSIKSLVHTIAREAADETVILPVVQLIRIHAPVGAYIHLFPDEVCMLISMYLKSPSQLLKKAMRFMTKYELLVMGRLMCGKHRVKYDAHTNTFHTTSRRCKQSRCGIQIQWTYKSLPYSYCAATYTRRLHNALCDMHHSSWDVVIHGKHFPTVMLNTVLRRKRAQYAAAQALRDKRPQRPVPTQLVGKTFTIDASKYYTNTVRETFTVLDAHMNKKRRLTQLTLRQHGFPAIPKIRVRIRAHQDRYLMQFPIVTRGKHSDVWTRKIYRLDLSLIHI